MSYYNNDDKLDRRRAESDRFLRSTGLVRNEYGHYDDPDKPWRTGAYIDPYTGQIHRDM